MTDDEPTRGELALRPMNRAEFDEWLPRNIAGYAEHIAASGAMPAAAAREKAEDEARARGMASLGLNVHGQNRVARSLSASLGHEAMSLQLKKAL